MDVVRTCRRQRKLKWNKGNYRELVNFKLPRRDSKNKSKKLNWKRNVSGTSARGNLFPIKVLQKEGSKVKVHYIGYDKKYDEWKDQCDVEMIADEPESIQEQTQNKNPVPEEPQSIVYKPYSLYGDLSARIKKAIICSRTASPKVNIVMPFDVLMFNGGMKIAGKPVKKIGKVQYYGISGYTDLSHLLGKNWHIRGLNDRGDYGYVIEETVRFFINSLSQ